MVLECDIWLYCNKTRLGMPHLQRVLRELTTSTGYEERVLLSSSLKQYNRAHSSLIESLLCTSDGFLSWRKWLDNLMLSITKSVVAWNVLSSFGLSRLKKKMFLASWQYLTASGESCFSKGRFFPVPDTIANIPSIKAARLNRKTRSSNIQQDKTKTGNSRISLKQPLSFIRMQKHLQNDPAPGQSTAQEGGAEKTSGDGRELESDCPSASDETQQTGNQKKEALTIIPPTHWKPKT